MDVKITKVIGVGNLENERVIMKAYSSVDIGRFAIFKTGVNISSGKKIINNRVRNAYWFPDKLINTNDTVVLYTKAGVTSEIKNDDGTTTYFFYWGLSVAIWAGDNGAVLASIPEWQSII